MIKFYDVNFVGQTGTKDTINVYVYGSDDLAGWSTISHDSGQEYIRVRSAETAMPWDEADGIAANLAALIAQLTGGEVDTRDDDTVTAVAA